MWFARTAVAVVASLGVATVLGAVIGVLAGNHCAARDIEPLAGGAVVVFASLLVGPLAMSPPFVFVAEYCAPRVRPSAGGSPRLVRGVMAAVAAGLLYPVWYIGLLLARWAGGTTARWTTGADPRALDHYTPLMIEPDLWAWSWAGGAVLIAATLATYALVVRRGLGRPVATAATVTVLLLGVGVLALHGVHSWQTVTGTTA